MGILDLNIVRRVRRNHAVEHATIHLLTPRYPSLGLAGRADTKGFFLYGAVDTDAVRETVTEALERLATQPALAVHPRCGTNLVVSGLVAGAASLLAVATMSDSRRRSNLLDVMPRLMLAGTAAAIASQGLGPKVQERLTTLPETEGVTVGKITRTDHGKHVIHRVYLEERQ